jgi:hypothetical protein
MCKRRPINLDTESGKRIYGAMKERALAGLSGRRIHPRHQAERAAPHHQDHQVAAGSVAGDVPDERAGAVKAADIRTVRDFEDALRACKLRNLAKS